MNPLIYIIYNEQYHSIPEPMIRTEKIAEICTTFKKVKKLFEENCTHLENWFYNRGYSYILGLELNKYYQARNIPLNIKYGNYQITGTHEYTRNGGRNPERKTRIRKYKNYRQNVDFKFQLNQYLNNLYIVYAKIKPIKERIIRLEDDCFSRHIILAICDSQILARNIYNKAKIELSSTIPDNFFELKQNNGKYIPKFEYVLYINDVIYDNKRGKHSYSNHNQYPIDEYNIGINGLELVRRQRRIILYQLCTKNRPRLNHDIIGIIWKYLHP